MTIEDRLAEIAVLCRQVGVRRLDVFGSAVGEAFDESTSDADFVVEFAGGPGFDHFDAYFSLKEGLEAILGRPVDLVTRSSIENPYFREGVEQSQELVYAARDTCVRAGRIASVCRARLRPGAHLVHSGVQR